MIAFGDNKGKKDKEMKDLEKTVAINDKKRAVLENRRK